jgi:hypothetical protein
MKPRARAFAQQPAPTTNRPGAGRVPAAKLEEWARQAVPNAVRGLLTQPHREIVRAIAALPDNVKRSQMLTEIARQAGREKAQEIRSDAIAWMQGVRVPA